PLHWLANAVGKDRQEASLAVTFWNQGERVSIELIFKAAVVENQLVAVDGEQIFQIFAFLFHPLFKCFSRQEPTMQGRMPPKAKPKFPFLLLEPSTILARTSEGRKRARDRGVRFGRQSKLNLHQRREALQRLANGESQMDVARSYQISLKISKFPF